MSLEAESGYRLESSVVSAFREAIMNGGWNQAEEAMERLGASDDDDRRVCLYPPPCDFTQFDCFYVCYAVRQVLD